MIEVRDARYFIAVAEELHFGRAAERLHMTQPPLSQAIRALEKRLHVSLLERSTRSVSLTPAGAVFLEQCRALNGASVAAEEAVVMSALGKLGEIRIGAVTSAFASLLPAALERFRDLRPGVSIRVEEIDSHDVFDRLKRRDYDLGLVRHHAAPTGFERRSLRSEPFALVYPSSWAGTEFEPGDLQQAADLPWVWLPREISPAYHDQIVACCNSAGFAADAVHRARSITSQLAVIGCGVGVGIVPHSSAIDSPEAARGAIRILPLTGLIRIELVAVWPTSIAGPVAEIVDCITDAAGPE